MSNTPPITINNLVSKVAELSTGADIEQETIDAANAYIENTIARLGSTSIYDLKDWGNSDKNEHEAVLLVMSGLVAQGGGGGSGQTGPAGPQGVQGPTGPQGPIGLTGPTGSAGTTGATGSAGIQGIPGTTGPQGPQGIQGPIGLTGNAGATGAQGTIGPQGATGADGVATSVYISASDFSAVPDVVTLIDGRIAQDSHSLSSLTANFTANDIGKYLKIYDVTNWSFGVRTTIASFVDTHTVLLTDASPVNMLTGTIEVTYGTDNSPHIQSALDFAFTQVETLTINVNNPVGGGAARVYLPVNNSGGNYLLASPIFVPRNVCLDGDAMLYNCIGNTGSDTNFPIQLADGGSLGTVLLDCAHGCGITSGTVTGDAHSRLEHIRLWNIGTDPGQKGLVIKGFDYDIGHLWTKGGNLALDMDTASDCHFDTVYIMGAQTPIRLNGCQNINMSKVAWDTNASIGLLIDTSHHVDMNIMSFNNYDGSGGTELICGVQVGKFTGTHCSNIAITYKAVQTGGVGLDVSNCTDSTFNLLLSDAPVFSNANGIATFDKAVNYGPNNTGFLNITVVCADTMPVMYTGIKHGNLYVHTDKNYILQTAENIGFGNINGFGGAVGALAQANATTLPSTAANNGYLQYSNAGVPEFMFSNGTVVNLANLGSIGAIGPQGPQGIQGSVGLTGNTGPAGSAVVTSDNKVVVLFGSSTIAGVGSSNWQGTPNNGLNPVSSTSWGGMLMAALTAKGFTCINQSIGGTYSQSSINRFYDDVAPLQPKFVIIATSIWNEPNITTDPEGAIRNFLQNTYTLVRRVESLGAIPVLIGQYSSWMTTPTLYGIVKSLYPILERMTPLVIDLLGASDNGTGTWLAPLTVDYTHPNDAGHLAFFNAVPITFFDQAGTYRKDPRVAKTGSWALNASDVTVRPLMATLDRTASSWSARVSVKADIAQSAKAYLSIGNATTGYLRVRNPATVLTLTDSVSNVDLVTSDIIIGDGFQHDIFVTYNNTLNVVKLYIDGTLKGSATPSYAATPMDTFVVAGKHDVGTSNGVSHTYTNFSVWRTCLNAEDVSEMYKTGRPTLKSLDVLATFSHYPQTTFAENAAMSTTIINSPGAWSAVTNVLDPVIQSSLNNKLSLAGGILSPTWNAAGTAFTGLTIDATDTASAATSLLMDLKISGTSKFLVKKTGEATVSGIDIGHGGGALSTNLVYGTGNMLVAATGINNTALGNSVLAALTSGVTNTGTGSSSLAATTTGSSNSGYGANALLTNTTGFQNTAVGKDSMKLNTSGFQNTAFGNSALLNNTVGNFNAAFGFGSLTSNTTGLNNLGFGSSSLGNVTTGSNNVALGFQSGTGIITNNGNVVIGGYTTSVITDNNIYLADGVGNLRVRIPSSGNMLIGTTTDIASAMLQLVSTTKAFLPPKMTTAQRDAITPTTPGLIIFNITTNKINVFGATAWEAVTSA